MEPRFRRHRTQEFRPDCLNTDEHGFAAPLTRSRSIRWPVVISVDNNHHCRRKSVNHRRDTDDGGHGGEHGRNFRRDKPGREEAEAAEKGNQTSSSRLPRVVALHAMRIVSRHSVCTNGS